MTKYKNKKTTVFGIPFDSKREAERYLILRTLERQGVIKDLRLQVRFELIPEQREPDTIGKRGGVKKGKVIERACDYVADFVYVDNQGNEVVEDAKGVRTKEYRIKKKLMLWVHKIKIKEW